MRKPKTESMQQALYRLMNDRAWWSIAELQQELRRWGYQALDTTVSARLRELRKPPWGRMLWTRTREGTRPTVYEYSIHCAEVVDSYEYSIPCAEVDAPPSFDAKTELEVMRLHDDKATRGGAA